MGQFLQIPYNYSFEENYDFYDEKYDPPIVDHYQDYEYYEDYEEINHEKIKYISDNQQCQYKIDYILNVELVEEKVISNCLEDAHGIFLDIV